MYMKKLGLLVCVYILCNSPLFSQIIYGPKVALTLSFAKTETLLFDDPFDYLLYEVFFIEEDVSPSFGMFAMFKDKNIFIQPEMLYYSTSSNFKYIDWERPGAPEFAETKVSHFLSFPIVAGVYLENFRFSVGPIFSFIIAENEVFKEFKYFEERREKLESGFSFSAGVSLLRLIIDFRYEFHFNKVADYFVFQSFQSGFAQSPGYLSMSLGYQF